MGSFIHIAEAFVMFVFYETPFESGEWLGMFYSPQKVAHESR